MTPTISIITTVYNRARYLPQAIESLLAQTRRDFELILWDDGSTDDTPPIAKDFAGRDPRIRLTLAEHRGRTPALNAALELCRGEFLGLLDSDDYLAADALRLTAAPLDNHRRVGMVYTQHTNIDASGTVGAIGKRCLVPYSKDRLLIDFMTFHFRLVRRSVFDEVGGIDASFPYAEDYDLCLRMSEVTEVRHVKQPLYFYRIHQDSISLGRQIEQIDCSKRAVENALVRRGYDTNYFLQVQLVPKFILRRKTETDGGEDRTFR